MEMIRLRCWSEVYRRSRGYSLPVNQISQLIDDTFLYCLGREVESDGNCTDTVATVAGRMTGCEIEMDQLIFLSGNGGKWKHEN